MSEYSLEDYREYKNGFFIMAGMVATVAKEGDSFGDLLTIVEEMFDEKIKEAENEDSKE